MAMLTPAQTALLDFERSWWMRPGPKDQSIEFDLGLTSAAYYELLLGVIQAEPAYELDPLTVLRVRAMIEPHQTAAGAVS